MNYLINIRNLFIYSAKAFIQFFILSLCKRVNVIKNVFGGLIQNKTFGGYIKLIMIKPKIRISNF